MKSLLLSLLLIASVTLAACESGTTSSGTVTTLTDGNGNVITTVTTEE